MAGKRVAVLDPDGNFGTVDETDVEKLPEGAKVLTRAQLAERAADEAYAQKSTAEKITSAASVAGPVPFAVRAGVKLAQGKGAEIAPSLPPAVESYAQGVSETFAGGVPTLAMEKATELAGGKEAGKAYVEKIDTAKEANPTAHTLGQVAGVAGSVAAGGPKGAGSLGKAIPGVGIAGVGSVIEGGVAKALGGLASKGVLGRAAATGARMAVRGAFEGGALAATNEATENTLHGDPVVGSKLYTAVGHGALAGGALGGILGIGGSAVASGYRGARSLLARAPEAAAEPLALAPGGRSATPVRINPDAGLGEAAPEGERAFSIGPEQREIGLRPNAFNARQAPETAARRPFTFSNRVRQFPEPGHGLTETNFRINPDAGLSPSQMAKGDETADVFRTLKAQPREVSIGPTGEAVEVGAGPLQIGEAADQIAAREASAAPKGKPLGVMDLLSQPNTAARSLAQDQAWRAIGGGFGLQSTRFAKQAAKFFPNGTHDLGEVALRYHLIDVSETATPMQAAIKAARSGTPSEILPKAQNALQDVGSQIGDITDSSGARVPMKKAMEAVLSVAKTYEGEAGRGPLAGAVRSYADELSNVLRPSRDGTVSVRDLLTQRKVLDDIVYEESKTLDPRGRVKALREVRTKLENLITDELDAASGKVKGELAAKYKTLKRDYHALSILGEAAEDSAARAAKGATFGARDVALGAAGIASGHVGLGTVLAAGGKIVRERGNAAAAAFLARAADNGSIEAIVGKLNGRIRDAAAGVLAESPTASKASGRASASEQARRVTEARADVAATQEKARAIMKWIGDMRADPGALQNELEDAHAVVSRAAGADAASTYTAATLRAIYFIAGEIPVKERRDPLDPRSIPPLSHDESLRLVRATRYAVDPQTIFADFARGKITPEGLRAVQLPGAAEAFADFQAELQRHVEEHMMRGGRLSSVQRLRIDKLLGYPAGADLRPASIARLQADLQPAPPEPPPANASPPGNPPVRMAVQQSGFDAIEARHTS